MMRFLVVSLCWHYNLDSMLWSHNQSKHQYLELLDNYRSLVINLLQCILLNYLLCHVLLHKILLLLFQFHHQYRYYWNQQSIVLCMLHLRLLLCWFLYPNHLLYSFHLLLLLELQCSLVQMLSLLGYFHMLLFLLIYHVLLPKIQ